MPNNCISTSNINALKKIKMIKTSNKAANFLS